MNFRSTRLLILIFVGLLAAAFVINIARQNTPVPTPRITPLIEVFPGIDATQITRIEVENRPQKRKITLVRTPGQWAVTDEKQQTVTVDVAQITRMIQILPTLRYNRVMEGSDLKAYGLADGGLFVVRFSVGDTSYALHVGDLNSDQTYSYVQREANGSSSPVLQVPASQVATLVSIVANPTP
jgi:hypothetical protein